jgi:regulator of replication initiation timing
MQKQLGLEYPEGIPRVQFLDANCVKVVNIGYTREFTPEEMDAMKDNLADVSIELNDLQIEKKELVKEINDKMKPKDKKRKALLENIRKKSEYVNEDCFEFLYQDSKMVGYYNSEGLLVSSRRMKSDEAFQTKIHVLKTGTND